MADAWEISGKSSLTPRMRRAIMGRPSFVVKATVQDIAETHTLCSRVECSTVRKALRFAWEMIGGIPGAYARVEQRGGNGRVVAELECDHRGELKPVELMTWRPAGWIVTELNPAGSIFAGVFA